jgi:D-alanyl-D-alanine endopeptidase (penicillin-binding protein 7)
MISSMSTTGDEHPVCHPDCTHRSRTDKARADIATEPPRNVGHRGRELPRVAWAIITTVLALLLAPALSAAAARPDVQSVSALVVDDLGNRLYGKNTTRPRPIASITKLMTAMVVLDAGLPLDDVIQITEQDLDRLRHSRSRLRIGEAMLSRQDMLTVALMSSDNRAAAALGRTTFAGGTPEFVDAMNRKAAELGMWSSRFADASGLDAHNQSTADDLARLVEAAARYPLIRAITSTGETTMHPFAERGPLPYRNTNPLVRDANWQVEVSKTGYINEAGRCLVMQAVIGGHRLRIVLLGAAGKYTPFADAKRLRSWLETGPLNPESVAASGWSSWE